MLNSDPIKEAVWEDINAQILTASGASITSKSCGSHKSGADIVCTIGSLSNKSTQYEAKGTYFRLSSYRLTTVCSDKDPGTAEKIVAEINARKNFTHYSVIVRDEHEDTILYDWYMIPADHPSVNPTLYTWTPKLGKIGKNAGAPVGWTTDVRNGSCMSITFSMSSQLWITVGITEELQSYKVASHSVKKRKVFNYIELYDKFRSDSSDAH